jgi:very-short-patch-repair endonuclease
MNEAKQDASLVFEHVQKHPERSLGVVTFSGAQQVAVENAINLLRSQNGQYEKFFAEGRENAFFVKNLESVQGDERDTIIFSIGYAKDQNGTMHMNFGPLSHSGGHRRLNVAITRAKYNVKLVGSIQPTDIRVEDGSPLGVRMLRQYIEYAINGPSVLQNEISFSDNVDTESPFEDAVYDYLVMHGYNIATQVGCSGYRIDLAVNHPTLNNVFVLGIECDGATYHSARTARERDRLRQTILEDIGWTIYRIWSTDWIKDPRTEGDKLVEAVRNAIASYDSENMEHHRLIPGQASLLQDTYIMVEQPRDADPDNPYGFDYYVETDISGVPSFGSTKQHQVDVINRVVELETPIHFDLLCRRVASAFGFQKVSATVQDEVGRILNCNLKDVVVRKQDFYWHRNVKVMKVKIPSLGGAARPINYICAEELAEAMFTIAGQSFGIARNDLYVIAARVFGFNRTGANITRAMDAACSYLLEQGIVKEVDGKIVL